MVAKVSRHELSAPDAAEALEARVHSLGRVLGRIEGSDMSRSRALDSALTVAKSLCAEDPEATRFPTWEAWVTAMQVGSALFEAGTASEGPVPCRIGADGEVKHLPATGPQPYLHAGAWLTTFYLAIICRENKRLEQLAQIPVSFLRASGAVFDEYIYDWVQAIQDFWNRRAQEMWDHLVAAAQGTDPATARYADTELLLKILYPPINLFDRYQRTDAAQFNEALHNALTWHKEYWTADEARSLSGDGLVALAPLAIACLARDADIPIEIESPYLPKALLEFSWAGEIDT